MKQVDIALTPDEGVAMRSLANSMGPGDDPIEFLASIIYRVETEKVVDVDIDVLHSLKAKLEIAREMINKPDQVH